MKYAAIAAVLGVSCAHEPDQPPVIVAAREVPPFRDAEPPPPKADDPPDAGAPSADADPSPAPSIPDASAAEAGPPPARATLADLVAVPVPPPRAPRAKPPAPPPPNLNPSCGAHARCGGMGCMTKPPSIAAEVRVGLQPRAGLAEDLRRSAATQIAQITVRMKACYIQLARSDPSPYGVVHVRVVTGAVPAFMARSPSLPESLLSCVRSMMARAFSGEPMTVTLEFQVSMTHDST